MSFGLRPQAVVRRRRREKVHKSFEPQRARSKREGRKDQKPAPTTLLMKCRKFAGRPTNTAVLAVSDFRTRRCGQAEGKAKQILIAHVGDGISAIFQGHAAA